MDGTRSLSLFSVSFPSLRARLGKEGEDGKGLMHRLVGCCRLLLLLLFARDKKEEKEKDRCSGQVTNLSHLWTHRSFL